MNTNAVAMESGTTLVVHMLIDGKEILPLALQNEDVTKGVLMNWTHVEPRNVQFLNETTFLVTYASGILSDEIGSAVKMIGDWLGKQVVITCDEVAPTQLPCVIECTQQIRGGELVVFNNGMDDMWSNSIHNVQIGYDSYSGGPAASATSGTTILHKIPGIPCFVGTEQEKDTVQFEQWYHVISDVRRIFNEQLVRAAITKSCVGVWLMLFAACHQGLHWMIFWKSLNGCMGL